MSPLKNSLLAVALTATAGIVQANEITEACKPGGGFFTSFPGAYTVKLKIGTHTFLDELVISSITRKPGMANAVENFKGSYTVPGIFTADVIDGRLAVNSEATELSFKILAQESGESYPVYFQAVGDACLMKGEAFSPTPDKKMGDFEMTKNSPDCSCPSVL